MANQIRHTPPRGLSLDAAQEGLYAPVDATYKISGPKLNRILKDLGITQSELAAGCGYTGISRISHIVRGENGKGVTNIKHEPLLAIVTYLNAHGANIAVPEIA